MQLSESKKKADEESNNALQLEEIKKQEQLIKERERIDLEQTKKKQLLKDENKAHTLPTSNNNSDEQTKNGISLTRNQKIEDTLKITPTELLDGSETSGSCRDARVLLFCYLLFILSTDLS